MRHTTISSPIDMRATFPPVVPFARTAVRLHPRRGTPTADHGSVGGPPLWPAEEPWPTCDDDTFDDHPDVSPLVPVVQLFAADVPDLPFPAGTDLMQMLWCPFDHDPWYAPRPRLWWRRRDGIGDRLRAIPAPHEDADPSLVPDACVIDPEPVVEYPSRDLPRQVWTEIGDAVTRVEEQTGWHYEYDLSVASGIKVGGYPGWTQVPHWPTCDCGIRMDHLLTVASWEFSRGDQKRWIPVEDRSTMDGWSLAADEDHPWRAIQNPAGIMLGDAGGVYLFVCGRCPGRPYDYRFDCA